MHSMVPQESAMAHRIVVKHELFERIEKEIQQVKQQQRHRRRQGIRPGPLQRPKELEKSLGGLAKKGAGPHSSGRRSKGKRQTIKSQNVRSMRKDQDWMIRQRIAKQQAVLNVLQKEYNGLKFSCKKADKELQGRKCQLKMLKRDDDVTMTRKVGFSGIHKLQAKMKVKQTELDDLLQYRVVMNHMASNLWNAQYTYEKTIKTYENALRVQQAEAAEVRELAQQVKKLKEQEEQELAILQTRCKTKRKEMEKELQERRKLKKQKEEMRTWFQNRLKKESTEEEKLGIQNSTTTTLSDLSLRRKLKGVVNQSRIHEEAFRKIQLATGLTNEEDIIDRYNNRDKFLMEVEVKVIQLQNELETANKSNLAARKLVEQTKFAGSSSHDLNRERIDTLTRRCDEARVTARRKQQESTIISKLFAQVQQSINCMHEQMRSIALRQADTSHGRNHASAMGAMGQNFPERVDSAFLDGGEERQGHGRNLERMDVDEDGPQSPQDRKHKRNKDRKGQLQGGDDPKGEDSAAAVPVLPDGNSILVSKLHVVHRKAAKVVELLLNPSLFADHQIQLGLVKRDRRKQDHDHDMDKLLPAVRKPRHHTAHTVHTRMGGGLDGPADTMSPNRERQHLSLRKEVTEELVQAERKMHEYMDTLVQENSHNIRVRTMADTEETMKHVFARADANEDTIASMAKLAKKTQGVDENALENEMKLVEEQILKARLRRRAIRSGKGLQDVSEAYHMIPHAHEVQCIDRGELKRTSDRFWVQREVAHGTVHPPHLPGVNYLSPRHSRRGTRYHKHTAKERVKSREKQKQRSKKDKTQQNHDSKRNAQRSKPSLSAERPEAGVSRRERRGSESNRRSGTRTVLDTA